MSRSTLAVLAVAAVVGLGGGSLAAVALEDVGPDESAAAESAPRGDLLYLDGRVLHDGDRTVRLEQPVRDPDRLVRLASGWLLAGRTSETTSLLWRVDESGAATDVAEVRDGWDLDPTRTMVVGAYAGDGVLTAWSVSPGLATRVLDRTSRVPEVAAVGWQGDRVVATEAADPDSGHTWVWRPGAEPRRTPLVLPTDFGASRDGDLVAGAVTSEGFTVRDAPNPCLLVAATPDSEPRDGVAPSVVTCDWRPDDQTAVFSPDGLRVMGIPTDSDGFGPGQLATFSSTAGPREGLAVIDLPERSLGAEWLDDRHVVVTAATDYELDEGTGTVLFRCTLSGACTEVARRDTGALLVGEPY